MKRFAFPLAFWIAALGCEKTADKKEPTPAPTSDEPSQDDGLQPAGAADRVVVTLVEAGAEPRRTLRFKFAVDQKTEAKIRMNMDMAMTIIGGPQQPKVNLPVMEAVMEVEVTKAEDATYSFDWIVKSYTAEETPGVIPQVLSGVRTSLAQLAGTKGTGKIDSRGQNLGATFETPPGVQPQVAQMMEGMRDAISTMSAPLPAEPIGVGGSWKVNQTMAQNGIKSNIEYVYTVTAIDGDKVQVATKVGTTGVVGPFTNAMMPPGSKGHLDAMSGSGEGTMTIALDRLVPPASNVSMSTNTKTTVSMMGQTQKLDMDMKLGIEISGK